MFEHIHIIGSGAIGSLLAAAAQIKHHSVIRHTRSTIVDSVQLLDQPLTTLNTQLNQWPQDIDGTSLIIVPLKSYQIVPAIQQYVREFPVQSTVVLLHNGMGCYQKVAHLLVEHSVFLATTSHGAYKPDSQRCMHTGFGHTVIGSADRNHNKPMQKAVTAWFDSVLSPVHWEDNIEYALWQKLAINALINPLTAIYNIRNGELLKTEYQSQLTMLAGELACVARAEGVNLSEQMVMEMARTVSERTANNFSSMLQDVKHQQTTEIDAITGYVIACADKHSIDCSTHRAVYEQIIAL